MDFRATRFLEEALNKKRLFKSFAATTFEAELAKAKRRKAPQTEDIKPAIPGGPTGPENVRRLGHETGTKHNDFPDFLQGHAYEEHFREGHSTLARLADENPGKSAAGLVKHAEHPDHPDHAAWAYVHAERFLNPKAEHNVRAKNKKGAGAGAMTTTRKELGNIGLHGVTENQHAEVRDMPEDVQHMWEGTKGQLHDAPQEGKTYNTKDGLPKRGHYSTKHVEAFATKMVRSTHYVAGLNRLFHAKSKNPNATYEDAVKMGSLSNYSTRRMPPTLNAISMPDHKGHNPLAHGDYDKKTGKVNAPHFEVFNSKKRGTWQGLGHLHAHDILNHLNTLPVGKGNVDRQALSGKSIGKDYITPATKAVLSAFTNQFHAPKVDAPQGDTVGKLKALLPKQPKPGK